MSAARGFVRSQEYCPIPDIHVEFPIVPYTLDAAFNLRHVGIGPHCATCTISGHVDLPMSDDYNTCGERRIGGKIVVPDDIQPLAFGVR
jgi:hypothetical protein